MLWLFLHLLVDHINIWQHLSSPLKRHTDKLAAQSSRHRWITFFISIAAAITVMNHVSERHLHLHLLLKMEPAKSRQSRCRTSAVRHENCRQIRQTDMDAFRKRRIPDNFDQETRTTNCTKSATKFSQQQTQSKSNCSYSQILDRRISPARTAQLSTHFHHQCSSPHRHPLSTLSLILLIITLLFSHSLLVSTAAHAASSSAKKTSKFFYLKTLHHKI